MEEYRQAKLFRLRFRHLALITVRLVNYMPPHEIMFLLHYFILCWLLIFLCYNNHFALSTCTEVDRAEIKWINKKSITSIGVPATIARKCKCWQETLDRNFSLLKQTFELNWYCRKVSNSWMHIDSICIWHLQKVQILRASSKYPTWTPQTTFAIHQIP